MNPDKKRKLKEVLRAMKGESIDFSLFDNAVKDLRKSLEEKVAIPTLDNVNSELEKFRKKIDLAPLLEALDKVKQNVNSEVSRLSNELSTKLQEQKDVSTYSISQSEQNVNNLLSAEISALQVKIAGLDMVGKADLKNVEDNILKLAKDTQKTIDEIKIPPDREDEIKALETKLNVTRVDLLNRISEKGGGNMNRQMFIGGVDPLTKYTDMNLKAGTNVTITYTNNNTTKKTDVTFSASGTGGSSRSVQSISANQVLDSAAGTDYVYICTGTLTLTMPTASGSSNLYTIKNAGTGVITILPDGADTLDNDVSIIMPVRYTSVDLISDSVANWNIT